MPGPVAQPSPVRWKRRNASSSSKHRVQVSDQQHLSPGGPLHGCKEVACTVHMGLGLVGPLRLEAQSVEFVAEIAPDLLDSGVIHRPAVDVDQGLEERFCLRDVLVDPLHEAGFLGGELLGGGGEGGHAHQEQGRGGPPGESASPSEEPETGDDSVDVQ